MIKGVLIMTAALKLQKQDNESQVTPLSDKESLIKKTIFIIEDDEVTLKQLSFLTKKYFTNVLAFNSAEAAEKFLKENPKLNVDILVSDYFMPGKNGGEVSSLIKKRNPETKTFVISGHMEEVAHSKWTSYIDEIFPKPIANELLIENMI